VADNDRAATLVGRAFASYPSSWDGPYTHGKWVYGPSFAVRLPDETGKYPVGKEWHKEILKKLVRSSAATDIVTIEDSKHEQTGLKTPCKFRAVRGTESHTELQFANLALGSSLGSKFTRWAQVPTMSSMGGMLEDSLYSYLPPREQSQHV